MRKCKCGRLVFGTTCRWLSQICNGSVHFTRIGLPSAMCSVGLAAGRMGTGALWNLAQPRNVRSPISLLSCTQHTQLTRRELGPHHPSANKRIDKKRELKTHTQRNTNTQALCSAPHTPPVRCGVHPTCQMRQRSTPCLVISGPSPPWPVPLLGQPLSHMHCCGAPAPAPACGAVLC